MLEEIYPMPSFPMLIANDLEASSRFYQDLGFKHVFTMPGRDGKPALVHLRWVKYADLLLVPPAGDIDSAAPKGLGISLNFTMFDRPDPDIDVFAKHIREEGANVVGPIDRPWNVREVTVIDPDGYRLVFTAPLNTQLPFEEVVRRAAENE